MIVLIEGIDRVGKTTLANKLESQGFIYLKDEFLLDGEFIKEFADYSVGKCDTLLALALKLNANGKKYKLVTHVRKKYMIGKNGFIEIAIYITAYV